jgi:sortase A
MGLVTEPDGSPPVVAPEDTEGFYLQESAPDEGEAMGRIRIPSITLRGGEPMQWTFVEGTDLGVLKNGAGHMPGTALPGQFGNAVISGHRTTYGAPFHNLDQLDPGDPIEVETAVGTHVYAVREVRVVQPTALWVTGTTDERLAEVAGTTFTDPRRGAWLTLTTCNPKFSARERLVVFAELVDGPNAAVIASAVEAAP